MKWYSRKDEEWRVHSSLVFGLAIVEPRWQAASPSGSTVEEEVDMVPFSN